MSKKAAREAVLACYRATPHARLADIAQKTNTSPEYVRDMIQMEKAKTFFGRRAKELLQTSSDGATASYYELPPGATELQDLITHKNMNAQLGEIFRSAYRYGESSHSSRMRDAKKIKFYIEAEIRRLENNL